MKLTLKIEYETDSTQYAKEQLAETIQKQLSAGTNVPVTVKIVNYGKVKKERNAWKMACESACQIIISGYCDGMEDTTDWEDAVYQWKEDNNIETYGIGVEELLGYLLEQAKKEGENK